MNEALDASRLTKSGAGIATIRNAIDRTYRN